MKRRKVTIKRIDASVLKPKKTKPFNRERFIRMAKELRSAVRKEEEKYGPVDPRPALS